MREILFTHGQFAVVPAAPDDAEKIARDLRPGDRAEIEALGHCNAEETIATSIALSPFCRYTMLDAAGRPVAAAGVAAGLLSTSGRPWMLGAMALDRPAAQRALLAFSRLVVTIMRERYDWLENYVDARYEAAVRWIQWMGFTVDPPAPYGICGEMFRRLYWRR